VSLEECDNVEPLNKDTTTDFSYRAWGKAIKYIKWDRLICQRFKPHRHQYEEVKTIFSVAHNIQLQHVH
jgi:hypothetical protein